MGKESLPLTSYSPKARSGGLLVRFQFARCVEVQFRSRTVVGGVFTGFGHLGDPGPHSKDRASLLVQWSELLQEDVSRCPLPQT